MSESIRKHLDFLRSVYKALQEQRREARKTELHDAYRFNPFRFFTTNENGLSAVLAFLLDPKESHGQGDLLLNAFLKRMKLYSFLGYESVGVSLEKTIGSKRRHDIFIEGFIGSKSVWALSIENKLRDAADQPQQIQDYIEDLKSKSKDQYCLVYLPSLERIPSEHSISKENFGLVSTNGHLKVLDAGGLIDWLQEAPIIAPKIRQFVEYFIQFLKEDVMGETVDTNELVEHIVGDEKNLESALEVIAAEQQIRKYLWQRLCEQLGCKCRERYPCLVAAGWSIGSGSDFKPYSRYMWLGFYLKNDAGVGIEFSGTYYHSCCYGVWKEQAYLSDEVLSQKIEELRVSTNGSKSSSWPFYEWLSGDLKNWEPSTWLRIPSGRLADELFEKWQPLLDIFEEIRKRPVSQ
ncbi:PD-(D/E)XK nuclease family protein [Neisseria sp. S1]|uniref:PDDEXK-like family protein n=1 Tax=Neisseria sp. S1 TaxID=3318354 RepID=UPI003A8ABF03